MRLDQGGEVRSWELIDSSKAGEPIKEWIHGSKSWPGVAAFEAEGEGENLDPSCCLASIKRLTEGARRSRKKQKGRVKGERVARCVALRCVMFRVALLVR